MTLKVKHLFYMLLFDLFAVGVAIWYLEDAHVAVVMAGARLAIGVAVVVAYAPALFRAKMDDAASAGTILSLGIIGSWFSHILFGAATFFTQLQVYRAPAAIIALACGLAVFAGALHLASSQSIEGRVPLKGWIKAGVASALGALAAMMGLVYYLLQR